VAKVCLAGHRYPWAYVTRRVSVFAVLHGSSKNAFVIKCPRGVPRAAYRRQVRTRIRWPRSIITGGILGGGGGGGGGGEEPAIKHPVLSKSASPESSKRRKNCTTARREKEGTCLRGGGDDRGR